MKIHIEIHNEWTYKGNSICVTFIYTLRFFFCFIFLFFKLIHSFFCLSETVAVAWNSVNRNEKKKKNNTNPNFACINTTCVYSMQSRNYRCFFFSSLSYQHYNIMCAAAANMYFNACVFISNMYTYMCTCSYLHTTAPHNGQCFN